MVLADHAEVAPEDFAILVEQNGSAHVHRALGDENFENALVVCKHWLRDATGHLLWGHTTQASLGLVLIGLLLIGQVSDSLNCFWALIDGIEVFRFFFYCCVFLNLHLAVTIQVLKLNFILIRVVFALFRLVIASSHATFLCLSSGVTAHDLLLILSQLSQFRVLLTQ